MERKTKQLLAGASLFMALAWMGWGCKDKEKPNPCLLLSPTSAEFKTSSNLLYFSSSPALKVVITDTFRVDENVDFTASDTTAESYAWKVGLDARTFTDKNLGCIYDPPNKRYTIVYLHFSQNNPIFILAKLLKQMLKN